MTDEHYKRIRTKLFGGYKQNPFAPLLNDRAAIRGPIQGSPNEFSQILYELTRGELSKRAERVAYQIIAKGRKDVLTFTDSSRFTVIKAKGKIDQSLIVIAPYAASQDDILHTHEMPLSHLVVDSLKIKDAYTHIAGEYRNEERRIAAEIAAEERRILRESSVEAALTTIEKARSGATIMIRGLHNIDALITYGFVPCLIDNPDNWIDAEDFPGMRYRHAGSGIELLMIAREKFRPIDELNRLEFYFIVQRSDDDPVAFGNVLRKFRETRKDGQPYAKKAFHDDLIALAKYPEELKGRSEEDLELIADEVEHVIGQRQELDKGILSYEAVFKRDTQGIVDHILKNKTPAAEIRKALDYFEYTGMIDAHYKATLHQQIQLATAARTQNHNSLADFLYDKRVKEIVTTVLRKIPKEHLTAKSITFAMAPYVSELGFGKLVKIRERILQLKDLVHQQER